MRFRCLSCPRIDGKSKENIFCRRCYRCCCLFVFLFAVAGVFLVACTVASGFKHTQLALFISLARDTAFVHGSSAHLLGTRV